MNFDRSRQLPAIVVGLAVACGGCGGYGPVSPAAFKQAKSLYTVSNLKARAALEATAESIDAELASGLLSAQEAAWLLAICDDCRAERWERAQTSARRMMEDQAQR
ncbi:hypothetical protein [Botrimarina hoheduenensis]|uniref:Uncharacterized protein n=1 Tax=Botrimarina hoheduenensis TaxID=2528000 RepID=A0A5C5VX74_9BACT|nr:hypothetical protein [Botrimarina hoheduenensis]TWT43228.1 hypothetical protein Pla111_21780 [Botrimarina hoheduenensis]